MPVASGMDEQAPIQAMTCYARHRCASVLARRTAGQVEHGVDGERDLVLEDTGESVDEPGTDGFLQHPVRRVGAQQREMVGIRQRALPGVERLVQVAEL